MEAEAVSKISYNTQFSSTGMDKINPIRIKKTGANQFQAVQVQPPALKINIVAVNKYPDHSNGKYVPFKLTTTRTNGTCVVNQVLVPMNDSPKLKKKQSLKSANKTKDAIISPLKKKKKKPNWRWIYIKMLEPSKQLVLSVHRPRDYPDSYGRSELLKAGE